MSHTAPSRRSVTDHERAVDRTRPRRPAPRRRGRARRRDRRAAPPPAPRPRDRPAAAPDPGHRAGRARRARRSRSATGTTTTSVTAVLRGTARRRRPAGRAAARGHGRPAGAGAVRGAVQQRGRRAPCTPAATTCTPRCSSGPRGCSAPTATRSPATSCSCSSRGRRAGTAPAYMLEEGVLDAAGPRVSAAYGMHVMSSTFPPSTVSTRPGTLMAASDGLHVTVRGAGGHGSSPHAHPRPDLGARGDRLRAADDGDPPLRRLRPRGPHGGAHRGRDQTQHHPGHARPARRPSASFSAAARDRIRELAPRSCREIAAAHGCEAEVVYSDEYPLTVNDAEHAGVPARRPSPRSSVPSGYRPWPTRSPAPRTSPASSPRCPAPIAFLGAAVGDPALRGRASHQPQSRGRPSTTPSLPDGVLLHAELAVRGAGPRTTPPRDVRSTMRRPSPVALTCSSCWA